MFRIWKKKQPDTSMRIITNEEYQLQQLKRRSEKYVNIELTVTKRHLPVIHLENGETWFCNGTTHQKLMASPPCLGQSPSLVKPPTIATKKQIPDDALEKEKNEPLYDKTSDVIGRLRNGAEKELENFLMAHPPCLSPIKPAGKERKPFAGCFTSLCLLKKMATDQ